jgi:hypothetical protein
MRIKGTEKTLSQWKLLGFLTCQGSLNVQLAVLTVREQAALCPQSIPEQATLPCFICPCVEEGGITTYRHRANQATQYALSRPTPY